MKNLLALILSVVSAVLLWPFVAVIIVMFAAIMAILVTLAFPFMWPWFILKEHKEGNL